MSANFYAWPPSANFDPGHKDFDKRIDALYDQAPPPAPVLVRFVDTLLARWPDLSDDDVETVWAAGPLHGEVVGDFLNIAVVWPHADEVWAFFRDTALAQGLCCYDPQSETLHRP